MNICYYNSPSTDGKYDNSNTGGINLLILLADKLNYSVDKSWAHIISEDINTWSNEKIHENFKEIYSDEEKTNGLIARTDQVFQLIKDAKHLKNKSKSIIIGISAYKSFINKMKSKILLHRDDLIEYNHIKELLPFVADGVWILEAIDYSQQPDKEYGLIKPIANKIINRENVFSFDTDVEDVFDFNLLDSVEETKIDFIKIPLWDLPLLNNMPYIQMKYTRDDLKQVLAAFNAQLNQLSEKIFNIRFSNENIHDIKELCKDYLNGHITAVQKSIDKSLYLNKMKNQFSLDKGLKFCFGISSAETIIDYYERTKNVEPYIASEIKNQVGKHIDLDASYIFSYFELHGLEDGSLL